MPDEHPAISFLRQLDPPPQARFNIETFTDVPSGGNKPRPDPLCRRYADQSADAVHRLLPELDDLNRQGAAIYVAVNECRGQRSKANVVRIRGVHADLDRVSEGQLAAIRKRLKPTIEVRSSTAENLQFYWLLEPGEELSLDTAEAINRSLVALGADPAATDASRLLRLPGFRHMKYRAGRPER